MRNVYQYYAGDDPAADEGTRWIAASTQAQADAHAQQQGWKPQGGEIYSDILASDRELRNFGCDVVLP